MNNTEKINEADAHGSCSNEKSDKEKYLLAKEAERLFPQLRLAIDHCVITKDKIGIEAVTMYLSELLPDDKDAALHIREMAMKSIDARKYGKYW